MKIFGVGFNYPCHQREYNDKHGGIATSDDPIIFHKGDSLLRANAPFFLPEWSEQIEYEVELVVQIARVGKYVAERFAHRYYDKISVGIDFTARDLQKAAIALGHPWTMAKCFDNAAAVGQWIDKGEWLDKGVEFSLFVDGERKQCANTADMLHSVDSLIEYISRWHTLKIGDIIFTGTPQGAGRCRVGQCLEAFLGQERLLRVPIK